MLKLINFKSTLAPAKALQLMSWSVQHFVETHLQTTHRQDLVPDNINAISASTLAPTHISLTPVKLGTLKAAGDENLKQRIRSDLIQISGSKHISPPQDPAADSGTDCAASFAIATEHQECVLMACGAVKPLPLQQHHLASYRHVIGAEDVSILRMVD